MDRSELMVSSGLYDRGGSPEIDRAIALVPRLEELFARTDLARPAQGFDALAALLGRRRGG
jgi:flagellum-specific ATP synthase